MNPPIPPYIRPSGKFSLFQGVAAGNVGNSFSIPASDVQDFTLASFGNPVRVLDVKGDDALGGMICVSLQQETILNQSSAAGSSTLSTTPPEGPLVGIVEFGAGSGLSSFQFDIPAPVTFPGSMFNNIGTPVFQHDLPQSKRLGGILLTLPASSLRVFVRNDAKAPWLLSSNANDGAAIPFNAQNQSPGQIRVHATYGRRPGQSFLTRSYPICFKDTSGGGTRPIPAGAGGTFQIGIPSYAKRVFFPRSNSPVGSGAPFTSVLNVTIFQAGLNTSTENSSRGAYVIPAGSNGPLDLLPYDTVLNIDNTVAAIDAMTVVFELGI